MSIDNLIAATEAMNALTARMTGFMDGVDADLSAHQAAYAALSGDLSEIVRLRSSFSATIDPDNSNPTNVDGGTFNSIKAAVDASPYNSVVILTLLRDKEYVIDDHIRVYGRDLRLTTSESAAGAKPILRQEAYLSGGGDLNYLRAFTEVYGGSVYLNHVQVSPSGKLDAGLAWNVYYNTLVHAAAPGLFNITLRACEVNGVDGYAIGTCSYGSQVRLGGFSCVLDGNVFGVRDINQGVALISMSNLTLQNGAALTDGGTIGTNLLKN